MRVVSVQHGVAELVGQRKAAQRFRQRPAEPDQVFIWLKEAIRAFWIIFYVKCFYLESGPGYEGIYRCSGICPCWMFRFIQ